MSASRNARRHRVDVQPNREKFHWLAEPYAEAGLRDAIVAAVEHLDERPLSELMSLLGRVKPQAAYPAALRGIQ